MRHLLSIAIVETLKSCFFKLINLRARKESIGVRAKSKASEMSRARAMMGDFFKCIFPRKSLYNNVQCFRICISLCLLKSRMD